MAEIKYIKLTDPDAITAPDPKNDIGIEESLVHKMAHHFIVDVVEKQDELIMNAIQRIGGDTYEKIAIDKNKVLDALGKYVAKKVVPSKGQNPYDNHCPTCGCKVRYVTLRYDGPENYCVQCGQHLDWSDIQDRLPMMATDEEECDD